jgi:hypothetical protein
MGAIVGILIVIGLTVAGISTFIDARVHGDVPIVGWLLLVVPLLVVGWIARVVYRAIVIRGDFLRRLQYHGGAKEALAAISVVALVVGGLHFGIQAAYQSQRPSAELTAALAPACSGAAVPGAGTVEAPGTTSNHLVLLSTDGTEHPWTGYPPMAWRPLTLDDAEFVACVSPETTYRQIEVCSYTNGPAITRYSANRDVKVVEAATGRTVASYTMTDNPRACGQTEQRDVTELRGDVGWADFQERSTSIVETGSYHYAEASSGPTSQPLPTGAERTPTTLVSPVPTQKPILTPKPGDGYGSRDRPVPLDTAFVVDDWKVTIDRVMANANQAIVRANRLNDPPAGGHQYYMISVTAMYVGSGSTNLDSSFSMRAMGKLGVEYSTFENSCGVPPDPEIEISDPTLQTGGTISGWAACWEIDKDDANSLQMVMKPLTTDEEVWFDLR